MWQEYHLETVRRATFRSPDRRFSATPMAEQVDPQEITEGWVCSRKVDEEESQIRVRVAKSKSSREHDLFESRAIR